MIELLLRLSIAGAVTSAALLLLTRLWKTMPKNWAYYLWLLALLRFLIPVGFFVPAKAEPARAPIAQIEIQTSAPAPVQLSPAPAVSAPAAPMSAAPAPAPKQRRAVDWTTLCGLIWLAGATVSFGVRLGLHIRFLHTLRRRRRPRLQIGRVRVCATAQTTTPLVVGLLRPMIYVPQGLSGTALALALRHELTHIRRGDLLYKWFVQLVVSIHWFDPAVYLAAREIDRLCELSCDAAAARSLPPARRKDYARLLLSFADPRRIPATELAGGGRRALEARVRGILNGETRRRKAVLPALCAALLMLLLAACSGAVVEQHPVGGAQDAPAQPVAMEPDTPPDTPIPPSDPEADYAELAAASYREGDFASAIRHARTALNETPDDPALWLLLTGSHLELEEMSEAAWAAQQGYAETADWYLLRQWAYLTCGSIYSNIPNWEQALDAYQDADYERAAELALAAITDGGDQAAIRALLGECYLAMGQPELAADSFAAGFRDTGDPTLARRELAVLRTLPDDPDRAARISELETALTALEYPSSNEPYCFLLLAQTGHSASLGPSQRSCLPGAAANAVTVDDCTGLLFRFSSPEAAAACVDRVTGDGLTVLGDDGAAAAAFDPGACWFRCEDTILLLFCGSADPQPYADALGAPFAGGSTGSPLMWFDLLQGIPGRYPDAQVEDLELPAFPGVRFRQSRSSIAAVEDGAERILMQGMPIWNVYVCDLNGDGFPELCATASFGSGLIDERVLVYDYRHDTLYELEDRGNFDYMLFLSDGVLCVKKSAYPVSAYEDYDSDPAETGPLVLRDGTLQMG